jgi:chemotaxis signal transduction protein
VVAHAELDATTSRVQAEPDGSASRVRSEPDGSASRVRSEPDGYVMLRLGGARYAVGMSAVAEVGRLPAMTRVPGTPVWLAGVANWRGRILAILDVRPLLDAPITPTGSLGRLVVLSHEGVTVGLLTEGVQGVVACTASEIAPPPMTLETQGRALLLGQFAERTGPIALLDPGALLDLRHRLPTPRKAAS